MDRSTSPPYQAFFSGWGRQLHLWIPSGTRFIGSSLPNKNLGLARWLVLANETLASVTQAEVS